MTDVGLLKQFIGLKIEQSEAGIKVIQPKYVEYMLLKFKMAEFKESKFPFLLCIKIGEFSASISQFVWSYIFVQDMWIYLFHIYCHTKLQWVNLVEHQVPKEFLATTHIV